MIERLLRNENQWYRLHATKWEIWSEFEFEFALWKLHAR